jgi:hypothetical protein
MRPHKKHHQWKWKSTERWKSSFLMNLTNVEISLRFYNVCQLVCCYNILRLWNFAFKLMFDGKWDYIVFKIQVVFRAFQFFGLNQGWSTQIDLWAATWKICQKYWLFGPQYTEKLMNTPKISKNRWFSIRDWATGWPPLV